MSKKKKDWRTEKDRLLNLGSEERRKEYKGTCVPLWRIPTWTKQEKNKAITSALLGKDEVEEERGSSGLLSDKVSLYKGDITILEVDAIVNAANSSLLGGGGVDGCIHKAAGPCLYDECHTLNGCETGQAKITCGYDLPAKYVIHTVGPVARGQVGKTQKDLLSMCYQSSLALVKKHKLRSVAFPCISTGIYGFPNEPAADIALETARTWMKDNAEQIDRVIFCVFLETDFKIYKEKMSQFFSPDSDEEHHEAGDPEEEGKKETPPSKKTKSRKTGSDEDEDEAESDEQVDVEMYSQTAESMELEEQIDEDVPEQKAASEFGQKPSEQEMEMECATQAAETAAESSTSELSPKESTAPAPQEETVEHQGAGALQTAPPQQDTSQDIPAGDQGDSKDAVSGGGGEVTEEENNSDTSAVPEESRTQGEDSQQSHASEADTSPNPKDATGNPTDP